MQLSLYESILMFLFICIATIISIYFFVSIKDNNTKESFMTQQCIDEERALENCKSTYQIQSSNNTEIPSKDKQEEEEMMRLKEIRLKETERQDSKRRLYNLHNENLKLQRSNKTVYTSKILNLKNAYDVLNDMVDKYQGFIIDYDFKISEVMNTNDENLNDLELDLMDSSTLLKVLDSDINLKMVESCENIVTNGII